MDIDAILQSDKVEAGYGDARILHGVSITVRKRRIVAVIGPNGSGKSTYLKTVACLVPHLGGKTEVRDRENRVVDVTRMQPYNLAAIGVSYVPQIGNIFGDMTVRENLQMGAVAIRGPDSFVKERIEAALIQFPILRSRLAVRAGTLSGGQRQMLAIARALVPDPNLLILDEPSASIQPDMVETVFAGIKKLRSSGLSVLLVEQRARRALEFSDYAYVVEMGRNRFEGTGRDLLQDRTVVDLYLGAGRPKIAETPPASTKE
jgi:ABC-type branched-subunit amino acid transport system ATPase component